MSFYNEFCNAVHMLELDHDLVEVFDKRYQRCLRKMERITKKMRKLRRLAAHPEYKSRAISYLARLRDKQEDIVYQMLIILRQRQSIYVETINCWIDNRNSANEVINRHL